MARAEGDTRAPSDLTNDYAILGTPAYMSPEQAAGARDLDARSDLFALCASMYEALSGERLWGSTAAKGADLMHVVRTRPIRRLDEVAPHLLPELVGIVHRGLERDRSLRWPDADALVDALGPLTRGTERIHVDDLEARSPPARTSPRAGSLSSTSLAPAPPDHSTQAFQRSIVRGDGPRLPAARDEALHASTAERPRTRRALLAAAAVLAVSGVAVYATVGRDRAAPRGEAPGAVVSSTMAASAGCTSSAECARRLSRPAVCGPRGVCAALESDECALRVPEAPAAKDSTIWLGMMFPRAGDGYDTLWGPAAQTVELAVRDVNDIIGGIRYKDPDRPARPLGLLACDDSDDARAERAARHLVEDLGVPAVIGFRSSKEVITLATSEFLPHGVVAVATFNKSALISSIPHPSDSPRLVWRLAPSNAQDAAPLSAFIAEILEPRLRAGPLGPRAPLRVTVVRPDSATGIGFEDGLLARLRFNGKPLAANAENFQELVFAEASADPLAGLSDKLVAFRPHVVAYPGDSITASLPEAVERLWRGSSRPFYVFGTPLQDEALARLVDTAPDLAARIVGISVPAPAVPNVKLAAHFNQTFGANQTATTTTPNAYDAVYLLAYAALASGDDTITGTGLARAIDRLLPPGEPLEVGPARILDGYNALRDGRRIDLVGASGPLDFDQATGDALFDYVFECLAVRGGHTHRTESGLRFELATRALAGSFTCR
jgi:branched-chain amino acid transport system substrate-binding protein